jgi:hypothetical protein
MISDQRLEAAKKYVDKQLETMKKYGSAPPEMSDEEYRALIEEVAKTMEKAA